LLTIKFPSWQEIALRERSTLEGKIIIASLFKLALQNTALALFLSLIVKTSVASAEDISIAGIARAESAERLCEASILRKESKSALNQLLELSMT
jgi:hypothetical protein